MRLTRICSFVFLAHFSLFLPARAQAPEGRVRYDRDILPILSQNCYTCHGPDEKARKADLRLDTHEGAAAVIEPGNSQSSKLIRRILSPDPRKRMPPAKTQRKLTPEQQSLLRRWVDQGAPWSRHWAYEPPVRPPIHAVQAAGWCRNPIDRFVLARLEQEKLAPAPEASREILLRRVTLDLTGLPPTLAEQDGFLNDPSPDAYDRLVDRLLASPRYGEREALEWLDEARYADTNGYQNDFSRTMWGWRDWVIRAANRNMPFDQFTIEQLAGDLLPGATLAQRIATGFNRNNRTVTEAGSIDEEWRVENAVDRVETTATVFFGLTLGCGRCHDHKFDPISQNEFYRFFAFFNSLNEQGVYTEQRGNQGPQVTVPTLEQTEKLRRLDAAVVAAENSVKILEAEMPARLARWEAEPRSVPAAPAPAAPILRLLHDGRLAPGVAYRGAGAPVWTEGPAGPALQLDGGDQSYLDAGTSVRLERNQPFAYGGWVRPHAASGAILSKMDDAAEYRGFDLLVQNDKLEVHLVHQWPTNAIKVITKETLPRDQWSHVFVSYDGSSKATGVRIYINGKTTSLDVEQDHLTESILTSQPLRIGKRSTAFPLKADLYDVRIYGVALTKAVVESLAAQPIFDTLRQTGTRRSATQQALVRQYFEQRQMPDLQAARTKAADARKAREEFARQLPTVMVMEELPRPRETFVLKRGRYDMPDRSQPVTPGVPSCLTPFDPALPRNRLGLARWLVDGRNPLTARVTVNRYWQRYFGAGLVKTAENFGVQGEPPSHPELLDWLASEFVRSGWNVKAMQRLIVTSATYRQSSAAGPALLLRDPENRLLARGPRFRLPAETVRDGALAVAGLLVERLGGPSIKPYQPAGLWEELAGGAGEGPYVQDKGPNLYRRSLYVYRKRTVPHPALATFDAPSREVCQVKRARTNTPLQALELLNDVTYLEAARRLASRMLVEGGTTPADRIRFAYRLAVGRAPTAAELSILVRGLASYRAHFQQEPGAAQQWLQQGESPVDPRYDAIELAAYAATASVILNLDETITKE